jgi:hypothetical protein
MRPTFWGAFDDGLSRRHEIHEGHESSLYPNETFVFFVPFVPLCGASGYLTPEHPKNWRLVLLRRQVTLARARFHP